MNVRNTVSAASVSAWQLIKLRNGERPESTERAAVLIHRLARDGRLWFWGESALPHFVAIILFMERTGEFRDAEHLLIHLLGAISNQNAQHGRVQMDAADSVRALLATLISRSCSHCHIHTAPTAP